MRLFCSVAWAFLFVAIAAPARAQTQDTTPARTQIQGVVVDAVTGETLPAASIQVEGTWQGTITNAEGQFVIEVDSLPAVLLARFVGYGPGRLSVAGAGPVRIPLQPMVYQLEEVVVSGEDPGERIMREVIRRKQIWRASLATYEAEAYNRFTMKNDTGIVSIMESATRAFWDREEGMREIVLANRRTNNMDIDEYLPAARFMANFYDDNIDIAGYTFIGVTHPDALRHYRFTLMGTWRQGDQTVYDIKVEPNNRYKTAFIGRLSVLDEVFALLDVALTPGESFLFPAPIKSFTISYEQQFADFDGEYWMPVDLRATMGIEISLMRLLSFPMIEIQQVTRLSNYKTNIPLPDSLYAGRDEVVVDSASVKAAQAAQTNQTATMVDLGIVRVNASTATTAAVADSSALDSWIVPLTRAESAAYETIDSTMTVEKAFKPTGAMARFVDMEDEEEEGDGEKKGEGRRGLGINWMPALRYNRVEEFYGGMSASRTFADLVTLRAGAGYATGPGRGLLTYTFGGSVSGKHAGIHVNYEDQVASLQPAPPLLLTANGLVMLMGGYDYFDYYRQTGLDARATLRPTRKPWSVSLGIVDKTLEALPAVTGYNLVGNDRIQPPNPTRFAHFDDPRLITFGSARSSLMASLKLGDGDQTFGVTGRRSAEIGMEWSQDGFLQSDVDFTRYWLDAEWFTPTLFKRRILPNQLHVRTVAFATTGDAPLWAFGALDSRMGVVSPFGRFKTLAGRPYTARSGAALLWEHNFRTFFFELLGWHGIAQKGYSVILFGGHGKTWDPDGVAGRFLGPDYGANTIHEAGVSLSGLFTMLRLDAAFRLDRPGFTLSLAAARLF